MKPLKKVNAEIRIKVSECLTKILEDALQPEIEKPSSDRSMAKVEIKNRDLVLHLKASDISAFRAAFNSYLRWVKAILDVVNI